MKMARLAALLAISSVLLVGLAVSPPARAWGCHGHEIVAIIAESHLSPRAHVMAQKILAGAPISLGLARYCHDPGLDAFADSSTWADDERSVRPDTAAWHFIDAPLTVVKDDLALYCPTSTGCITSALAAELAILKNPRESTQARADALRFVIHFVGDIHQPLHTVSNNDRGGNCVPVEFFGRAPQETNAKYEAYSPNLHQVWDVDIIDKFSGGASPQILARDLDEKFRAQIPVWESQPADFSAWAWESHELAVSVAYGRLPRRIEVELPRRVASCTDDDHVSRRMLQLHEDLGADYQSVAAPVVEQQLAKAGARLAALLNSLWP
jgi:hypothetical protein